MTYSSRSAATDATDVVALRDRPGRCGRDRRLPPPPPSATASRWVRARATDEHGLVGDWSVAGAGGGHDRPVDAVSTAPVGGDTWLAERITDTTTCTFTATGVADFEWRRTQAGTVEDQPAVIAASGAGTTASIPVPTEGVVKIEARARTVRDRQRLEDLTSGSVGGDPAMRDAARPPPSLSGHGRVAPLGAGGGRYAPAPRATSPGWATAQAPAERPAPPGPAPWLLDAVLAVPLLTWTLSQGWGSASRRRCSCGWCSAIRAAWSAVPDAAGDADPARLRRSYSQDVGAAPGPVHRRVQLWTACRCPGPAGT